MRLRAAARTALIRTETLLDREKELSSPTGLLNHGCPHPLRDESDGIRLARRLLSARHRGPPSHPRPQPPAIPARLTVGCTSSPKATRNAASLTLATGARRIGRPDGGEPLTSPFPRDRRPRSLPRPATRDAGDSNRAAARSSGVDLGLSLVRTGSAPIGRLTPDIWQRPSLALRAKRVSRRLQRDTRVAG